MYRITYSDNKGTAYHNGMTLESAVGFMKSCCVLHHSIIERIFEQLKKQDFITVCFSAGGENFTFIIERTN